MPQFRERFFIVGASDGLNHFHWPKPGTKLTSIHKCLDKKPTNFQSLEPIKSHVLDTWQEFLDRIPIEAELPKPIWSMEFGATYEYERKTPFGFGDPEGDKGSFGTSLKELTSEEKSKRIPRYAHTLNGDLPKWKKNIIKKNRVFYSRYKKFIDPVKDRIEQLRLHSHQKFEWHISGGPRKIRDYIIQFRGSGIRVKHTDFSPALVTIRAQVPIIGWENRYITPIEAMRLQSIEGIQLPDNLNACFTALGNSVNISVVKKIVFGLLNNQDNMSNE